MMYALVAVGVDGAATLLAHHADGEHAAPGTMTPDHPSLDAWALEFEQVGSKCLADLGLETPREVGLHVWKGRVEYPPAVGEEGESLLDVSEPAWRGTWRRATAAEALHAIVGRAVFEQRPAVTLTVALPKPHERVVIDLHGGGSPPFGQLGSVRVERHVPGEAVVLLASLLASSPMKEDKS